MMKKIKNEYEEWAKNFNLVQKYPNYFHLGIIRVGLVVAILIPLVAFFASFSHPMYAWAECDNAQGCLNPFVECEKNPFSLPNCAQVNKHECRGQNCDKAFLSNGEIAGTAPPPWAGGSMKFSLFVVIMTFALNHLHYKITTRRVRV